MLSFRKERPQTLSPKSNLKNLHVSTRFHRPGPTSQSLALVGENVDIRFGHCLPAWQVKFTTENLSRKRAGSSAGNPAGLPMRATQTT
jgi:hypothetical protein